MIAIQSGTCRIDFMMKTKRIQPIVVPVPKPVCRTPIKPMERHAIRTKYTRKPKHPSKEMQ